MFGKRARGKCHMTIQCIQRYRWVQRAAHACSNHLLRLARKRLQQVTSSKHNPAPAASRLDARPDQRRAARAIHAATALTP